MTYTFIIENQSSNPLYGVQFTDILPEPLEWVYKPYNKEGLSINIDDFLEGQTASFLIDVIDAETVASFVIDAYVGDTDVEVQAENTARIEGFPPYINNGADFLESNTTVTRVLGDIEIISVDTIFVTADQEEVKLSAVITSGSNIEWTTSGDGSFSDNSIVDPIYTLGEADRLDTLIGLFIGVDTYCGQKGKSVFIERECNLEFNPIGDLKICEGQTLDTLLSWTGGVGPYTIEGIPDTINTLTTIALTNLEEGSNVYVLKDAMGCESELELDISSLDGPETTSQITEDHCGQADGSLTLEFEPGAGPFTITGSQVWDDVTDELKLEDLAAGEYTFLIADKNGCVFEETYEVPASGGPIVDASVSTPDCSQEFGWIELTWTGIQSSYQITGDLMADNVESPHTIDQLESGTYVISLTDAFGCAAEIEFEIETTPAPEANTTVTCIDSTKYSISISTGDFEIESDLGLTIMGIGQGEYEIVDIPITDAIVITVTNPISGCESILSISPPNCSCGALVDVELDQELSCYEDTVTLDASASSQGSGYNYAWYNSSGDLLSTELIFETELAGTYIFEITDVVNDCTSDMELTVTDIRNTPPAVINAIDSVLTCNADSLELVAEIDDHLQYKWIYENGSEILGDEIKITSEGIVTLEVIDTISGCTNQAFILIEADNESPNIIITEPELLNCSNTIVTIDGSDSDLGKFTWLDSTYTEIQEDTESIEATSAGLYYLLVENDDNGCFALDSVVISENYSVPEIDMDAEANLSCDQNNILLSPTIVSDNNFSATWSVNGNAQGNEANLSINAEGIYFLEIQDLLSNCIAIDSVKVNPPNEIDGLIFTQTNLECYGDFSGTIDITEVIGGTEEYNYYLNDESVQDPLITDLSSGNYAIYIEDALGCAYDTLINLTEPTQILSEDNYSEYLVNVGTDVEVSILTNTDINEIESVKWKPEIGCQDCLSYLFENVQEYTTYQVTIVNKNGCEESLELRLLVDNNIYVYLPNVISANSQGNNVFFPQTRISSDIIVKEMSIYDRWGNQVFKNELFQTNKPESGWDGRYLEGTAEMGVYIYTLILENGDETIYLSGDVTLIR